MIRTLLIGFALLTSASAMANPFDGFIGSYTVVGAPSIRKVKAKWCNRFDFAALKGFGVAADANGHKQSHMLKFYQPYGWSGHPVMDFRESSEMDPNVGSYARTTGAADFAATEYGSFGLANGDEKLTVRIERSESGYSLLMAEELTVKGAVSAGCYYQANLTKK